MRLPSLMNCLRTLKLPKNSLEKHLRILKTSTTFKPELMQDYINMYFETLIQYYNANRLSMNADKTAIMISGKAKDSQICNKIKINNDEQNKPILQKDSLKSWATYQINAIGTTQ